MKKNIVIVSIPSKAEYLSAVRKFISELMIDAGWDEEQSAELEIALYEVLMNVVEHAYNMSPDFELKITVNIYPSEVIIEVEDEGKPFDSTQIVVPNLEEVTKKKQMIGKYLIKSFTSKIEYKRSPKGGNILRIIKQKRK